MTAPQFLACSYDATFAGFLTLVAELFRRGAVPASICRGESPEAGLFIGTLAAETSDATAALFAEKVAARMSPESLRRVYHAFLSEAPGVEMLLFRYLSFGRQEGRSTDSRLTHEAVFPVHRLVRQVRHEAHRLKGFVRFAEISPGLFYAPLEPDFFVLPLIAGHFASRFAVQEWIIHDVRRDRAVFHHGGRLKLGFLRAEEQPHHTERESRFRELWQRYFREAAVEERSNLLLQRTKLPRRYRKYLLELEG